MGIMDLICCEPTHAEIQYFFRHPDFAQLVQGQGDPDINTDDQYWLLIKRCDGAPIALFNLTPTSAICVEGHPLILKAHRVSYGRQCMETALVWCWSLGFHKIVAEIPATSASVINFVKHFGFVEEGINRESVMVNGKITDRIRLGLAATEAAKRGCADAQAMT